MTSITLIDDDGTVTIEVFDDCETMQEMLEKLIVPALLGMTYQQETIDKYIDTGGIRES
jgi:hypothetical protein